MRTGTAKTAVPVFWLSGALTEPADCVRLCLIQELTDALPDRGAGISLRHQVVAADPRLGGKEGHARKDRPDQGFEPVQVRLLLPGKARGKARRVRAQEREQFVRQTTEPFWGAGCPCQGAKCAHRALRCQRRADHLVLDQDGDIPCKCPPATQPDHGAVGDRRPGARMPDVARLIAPPGADPGEPIGGVVVERHQHDSPGRTRLLSRLQDCERMLPRVQVVVAGVLRQPRQVRQIREGYVQESKVGDQAHACVQGAAVGDLQDLAGDALRRNLPQERGAPGADGVRCSRVEHKAQAGGEAERPQNPGGSS